MDLNTVSRITEDEARQTLERIRWPEGPVCAHCGSAKKITKLNGKAHREGLYKCNSCGEQFTVTVGTIFEASHIPLRTWLMAFAIMCSSKKGVSALQLQRQLGLGSYRSAWHMAHRIRHAMSREPLAGLLKGKVEVDETFVGGKPRKGAGNAYETKKDRKTPVMALVERGGRVKAMPIKDLKGRTLKALIRENVDKSSMILTDEYIGYRGIGHEFWRGHPSVNHSKGEYARKDGAHVNTAESFFALLKRGIMGSFHHVSRKHLGRYVDEFAFRWDHREATDSDRTVSAIKGGEGKRLIYRDPISR